MTIAGAGSAHEAQVAEEKKAAREEAERQEREAAALAEQKTIEEVERPAAELPEFDKSDDVDEYLEGRDDPAH